MHAMAIPIGQCDSNWSVREPWLHAARDILVDLVETLLSVLRLGPANNEARFLGALRDEVEVDMGHDLVGDGSVVLQNIVPVAVKAGNVELRRHGNLLGEREQVGEVLVRDVVQLLAVVLRDHQRVAPGSGANVEKSVRLRRLGQLL